MAPLLTVGVIGGSGLYAFDHLERVERVTLETPFGAPSDEFVVGEYAGKRLVFLPRHGSGHRLLPHELNFRANIWGMKKLGVSQLLSVSAVGSLREDLAPGQVVFVDQFLDLTRRRASTFFGDGVVVHVPFADPVSTPMRRLLERVASSEGLGARSGGTYVCIEGPQFSTRAESKLYRSYGADVIGMTNMPEAKLAREAGISYATIALVTDYDCWHETEESVSVEAILKILSENVDRAQRLIRRYVEETTHEQHELAIAEAARRSLITPLERISSERRRALAPILFDLEEEA